MSLKSFVPGGLPGQDQMLGGKAVFTEAYAVIPGSVMRDIVTSLLPGWTGTRAWILARPLSGFAETFCQYLMEVAPGGGSEAPEPDPGAQAVLFVTHGELTLRLGEKSHKLSPGGYAYIPPGMKWSATNGGESVARFHWYRKRYVHAEGIPVPDPVLSSDAEVAPEPMPDCDGVWATTRFIDQSDLRHDMVVNLVTFEPGGCIPFMETHVMEHGIYVLQGKAVYRLNRDWVEVEAGDFLWLRAFCPQACYAGGPEKFRYLLYKDINRHPAL
jgi:(S)-ureidoglycine aminohydrolase